MNLEEYDFDRLLGLGYTEKATGDLKDACWKGYTAVGTKKKGGRTVPNCVPIKKSEHSESEDFRQIQMGGDLLVDVECDTNLPLSTPAELREAKMRKRVVAAQNKAQRQEAREQAKRARDAKRASRAAKKMQQGFAEEMKHKPLIAGPSAGSPSFAESDEETLDFTRCQRPDGTAYGTGGKCRSGVEAARELQEKHKSLSAQVKAAKDAGDLKKAGKLAGQARKVADQLKKMVKDPVPGVLKSQEELKKFNKEENKKVTDLAMAGKIKGVSKKDVMRIQLRKLEEKMDDAATLKEQQRYSAAIKDLQKRMEAEG